MDLSVAEWFISAPEIAMKHCELVSLVRKLMQMASTKPLDVLNILRSICPCGMSSIPSYIYIQYMKGRTVINESVLLYHTLCNCILNNSE